jgi:hypothetical protein
LAHKKITHLFVIQEAVTVRVYLREVRFERFFDYFIVVFHFFTLEAHRIAVTIVTLRIFGISCINIGHMLTNEVLIVSILVTVHKKMHVSKQNM